MDMTLLINLMITMLLMLIVGVVLAKLGVVDPETNRRLNRFAMAVPQCATILASAMNMEPGMEVSTVLTVLGIGVVMYALLLVLGFLVPKILRLPRNDRGLYSVLTIFGNVGFMGMPLTGAMFGSEAVFYSALLTIPFNLLAFTVGIRLVGGTEEKFDWHKMISPVLISSILAAVMVFLPLKDATSYFGTMLLPLSMVIVGASLGEQKLKNVFTDWRIYLFAPARLLVAPVLLWAVIRTFISDPLMLGVVTVVGATPCAAISVMLSMQYGGDEKTATRAVFLTTVLSVITIPFVCWLLLT